MKLFELLNDILTEFSDDLTPEDLKKFNRIMQGKTGVENSIHNGENGEKDYQKKGFGYGGPSHPMYRRAAPDRPYRSDKGSVGSVKTKIVPEI